MKVAYQWFGRLMAMAVFLYSGYLLIVIFGDLIAGIDRYSIPITAWIVASGLAGLIAPVMFLASLDGPERFHRARYRVGGWALMMVAVLLPSSVTFFLAPLTAATIGLVFLPEGRHVSLD